MPNIDKNWVSEQMAEANVPKKTQAAINKLLDVWQTIVLTEDESKECINLFHKLALVEPIFIPVRQEEMLVQGRPGNLTVGDEVIILPDAYANRDVAVIHNGRRCRIVGIRHGDIIVKYEDGKVPQINDARHSAYKLLKVLKNNG